VSARQLLAARWPSPSPRSLGSLALTAWHAHKALSSESDARWPAILRKFVVVAAARVWEQTVEPLAAWTPFYNEVKLALLLWVLGLGGDFAVERAFGMLAPAVAASHRFAKRSVFPPAQAIALITLSRLQRGVLQLVAPALPPDELREWEQVLGSQAQRLEGLVATPTERGTAVEPTPAERGGTAAVGDKSIHPTPEAVKSLPRDDEDIPPTPEAVITPPQTVTTRRRRTGASRSHVSERQSLAQIRRSLDRLYESPLSDRLASSSHREAEEEELLSPELSPLAPTPSSEMSASD
jgi:hypothetical protein